MPNNTGVPESEGEVFEHHYRNEISELHRSAVQTKACLHSM